MLTNLVRPNPTENGPAEVNVFHLIQMKHAMRFEINSGMKMSRGSLITTANRCGYSKKKTKAGVLADVEALLEAQNV